MEAEAAGRQLMMPPAAPETKGADRGQAPEVAFWATCPHSPCSWGGRERHQKMPILFVCLFLSLTEGQGSINMKRRWRLQKENDYGGEWIYIYIQSTAYHPFSLG